MESSKPARAGPLVSSAPAGGGEPVIGSRRRPPVTLVTRCRHRLLPRWRRSALPRGQQGWDDHESS